MCMFVRQGGPNKMPFHCIMGNEGSRVFGEWPMQGTKSQDTSASALILTILFYFLNISL